MSNISAHILPSKLHEILEELYTLRRFHASAGLHRIQSLLEALGNPQDRFPSIHIAGTNGKGTVSSVIASALTEAGFRVGLYTSPHILRFNERIRIGGVEISDDELLRQMQRLMPLVMAENATFFEAATALAFRHFADNDVDVAVIETGLGGRLDATNILSPRNVLITAITSIDYDHTEYLGETLPEIASEKAGIMKRGAPCIVAEPRQILRPTFEKYAAQTESPLHVLDEQYAVSITRLSSDFLMEIALSSPKHTLHGVESRLCGTHQARNILTAFAVLEHIHSQFPITPDQFRSGLQNISVNSGLRGRIELLRATPPIVMDVAHNPSGVAMLIQTLTGCGYDTVRWNVLFTAMQDKQAETMLAALAPVVQNLYVPTLDFARARAASDIVQTALGLGLSAEAYPSVAEACRAMLARNEPLLIAGSFHLAEEALHWWEALESQSKSQLHSNSRSA
jgi:dihydrofolate synthase/folylpolyglutamate synthase